MIKKFKVFRLLVLILIFGLAIRVFLNGIVHSNDAQSFVIWASYLQSHSIADLYKDLPQNYLPYPPTYYYLLKPLGAFINAFNLDSSRWMALFVVKLPVLTADVILTILIYKYTKKYISTNLANASAAFYFLNPAIIYNTSIWGQIDSIIIALGFSAIYLFINKNYLYSLLVFLLGTTVKLQMLALLPLFFAASIKKIPVLELTKFVSVGTLVILALFVPLILDMGFTSFFKYIYGFPNQYPYTSIYAFNIWAPRGFIISDSDKFLNVVQYRYLGLLIFFAIASLIVFYLINNLKKFNTNIMFAAYMLFFDFFYFSTRIHSRYLIYTLGFFAPFAFKYPKVSIALSIFVLINLLLPDIGKFNPQFAAFITNKGTPVFTIFGFILFAYSFSIYKNMARGKS